MKMLVRAQTFAVATTVDHAQSFTPAAKVLLPEGDWTATYSLVSRLGLKSPAAEIVSNEGDADRGMLVTVGALANRSAKTITSVRFG